MSKLTNISTKIAVKYLKYEGPVFQKRPLLLDPAHENYPALKLMAAAYYHQGGNQ